MLAKTPVAATAPCNANGRVQQMVATTTMPLGPALLNGQDAMHNDDPTSPLLFQT